MLVSTDHATCKSTDIIFYNEYRKGTSGGRCRPRMCENFKTTLNFGGLQIQTAQIRTDRSHHGKFMLLIQIYFPILFCIANIQTVDVLVQKNKNINKEFEK